MSPATRCRWCARPFIPNRGELFCTRECRRSEEAHRARDAAELRRVMDARLARATGRTR